MADDNDKTVRIKRPSRVAEDARGRNVWVGRVESVELELVSTTALEKILKTGDGQTRTEIRRLAESGKEGLLARDAEGRYEILSDEELQGASGPAAPATKARADVTGKPLSEDAQRQAAELSLVSTQFLRKVVGKDGQAKIEKAADAPASGRDRFGGFDPYNKS